MALEEELARLETSLLLVSVSAVAVPMLSPACRALAMKSFEMCLEHSASVMTELLRERGSVKACKGSEPFRILVSRAKRAGIISDAKGWRRYRDWRNESVHRYSDEVAERILGGMLAFLVSVRGLLELVDRLQGGYRSRGLHFST